VSVSDPKVGGLPAIKKPPLETSGGMVPWLIQQRVSLVFSSYRDGHIYFLGSQRDGSAVFSRAQFPGAMGLVAFAQRIYLASQMQIWRLENILKPGELANGCFDRVYVPRNAQITGALDAHEIGVETGGRIIIANTKFSCLATPSMTHAFKPVWKPRFISALVPEDRCHLNGLATEDGHVRYVTACATTDIIDGWREHRAEGGVLIDVSNDRIVCEGLSMPHSPRVHGGAVWLLNSGTGYLCRVDPANGTRENVAFCPGFLRGLAMVDHYAVAGLSLPRYGRLKGLALEDEMTKLSATPWCGVLVIDTRTGGIVQWVRFTEGVEEIFGVAAITDVRCPRGVTPNSGEMQDTITFEVLSS
jgi:uncharacterized protein (TIGR03032 family)